MRNRLLTGLQNPCSCSIMFIELAAIRSCKNTSGPWWTVQSDAWTMVVHASCVDRDSSCGCIMDCAVVRASHASYRPCTTGLCIIEHMLLVGLGAHRPSLRARPVGLRICICGFDLLILSILGFSAVGQIRGTKIQQSPH